MSKTDWTAEALKCSADIIRTPHRGPRGVMKSDHGDTSVVFAPEAELDPIKERLSDAGIEILGTAHSTDLSGGDIFTMIVRSTDHEALKALIAKASDTR